MLAYALPVFCLLAACAADDWGRHNVRRSLGRLCVAPRTCRSFLTAGATQKPILPSSRRTKDTEMCNLIRYLARRIEGRIRRLRRCRRGYATSPGIGAKPSFYLTRSTSSQVVCSKGARKNPAPVFFCLLAACPAKIQPSSVHLQSHGNSSKHLAFNCPQHNGFCCRDFSISL